MLWAIDKRTMGSTCHLLRIEHTMYRIPGEFSRPTVKNKECELPTPTTLQRTKTSKKATHHSDTPTTITVFA